MRGVKPREYNRAGRFSRSQAPVPLDSLIPKLQLGNALVPEALLRQAPHYAQGGGITKLELGNQLGNQHGGRAQARPPGVKAPPRVRVLNGRERVTAASVPSGRLRLDVRAIRGRRLLRATRFGGLPPGYSRCAFGATGRLRGHELNGQYPPKRHRPHRNLYPALSGLQHLGRSNPGLRCACPGLT